MPALRERIGDILSLAEYFLGIYSQRLDLPVPLISEAAQHLLERHSWPGNTRELENVIHFALLVSTGEEILPEHLNLPQTLMQIESQIGPIEAFVFNIGANVPCSILEETARKYFKIWEMACFSGFLNGREVAKRMAQRQRGTILFTGATAGLRGAAGFAAFAGAKHGIRALAQSMARELGPMNIHVAHVVVDGAIDTDFIRDNFPEKYATKDQDGILNPEHIADNYWHLHSQPRDAWTFELDLRPWNERW